MEAVLEILIGLAPGSFDTLAAVGQYLTESSWETSKTSIHLVLGMNTQTIVPQF